MRQKLNLSEQALDYAEALGAEHAEHDVLFDLGLVLDEELLPRERPVRETIVWASPFYRAIYEAAYVLTYDGCVEELSN